MARKKRMAIVNNDPSGSKEAKKQKTATSKKQKTTPQVSSTNEKSQFVSSPTVDATCTEQPQQPTNSPTINQPKDAPKPNKRKKVHFEAASTEHQEQDENPHILRMTKQKVVALKQKQILNDTTTSVKMTKQKVVASKPKRMLYHIDPASTPSDLRMRTKFMGPRTLHWDTLEKLKVHSLFNEWLTPVWKNFFKLQHPVYRDLVFEFFSTYRFNKKTTDTVDVTSDTAMSFSLCGKEFCLSFKEFAVAMNLYTEAEVENEDLGSGLTSWPSDATLGEFWNTFGVGEYQKNLSCTSIKEPAYRILHRLIAESINQRGSCTNLVTQDDMFYMFCILNKRPCNLTKCLARYLYKSSGKTETSAVCGGAYVTQLAIGLKAVDERKLAGMEQLASTTFFDVPQLRRLEIIDKSPTLRFVDHSKGSGNTNQEVPITLASLAARVTNMESEIRWQNRALHFGFQKLGHSFEPPPHMLSAGERPDGEMGDGERSGNERADDDRVDGDRVGEKDDGERAAGERPAGKRPAGKRTVGKKTAGKRSATCD